ncbi:Transcriptional regulatory protein moc3, partial [Lachnellula suecica]
MTERVLDLQMQVSPGAAIRKTRASKPKVKTGCQTCKIRRVKCDETKPHCLRCAKFGHQCDGYVSKPISKPSLSIGGSRLLVPKSQSRHEIIERKVEAKLCPTPATPTFRTQHEHDAFTTFCSSTVSASFSSDLWTRLMLQACETEPAVRHAVVALGALNLDPSNLLTPTKENGIGTLRHQFAFRQYSKALCLLRRDVAGGKHDLRTTLIASLLFYCFESFQGYHELAISQVYTGLKLIREWASSFYKPRSQEKVEDDVLRAFGSLEIQVMLYADGRTREAHEHYRRAGQVDVDEMPGVFGGLEEARRLLECVIRRSMHWLRSTMHLHTFTTASEGEGNLFFDVDPTFSERVATLSEYERWDGAFSPLLNHARSRSAPHETFILASTLRLHWLAGYLSIESNNSRSALLNNSKYTVLLQELVGIARLLLKEEDKEGVKKGGYVFDMQIIVPLLT